ncbi:MAG: hypothetical protein HY830_25705 [Actinobacteria bacterium]|nr:hypothetical protein [Actinomycetota bacterium]
MRDAGLTPAADDGFVRDVAARRGATLRPWTAPADDDAPGGGRLLLVGGTGGVPWSVTLAPGSPAAPGRAPVPPRIVWCCTDPAVAAGAPDGPGRRFGVRRGGPGPGGCLGPGWTVDDPRGVLDDDLVPLVLHWPHARWGPADERPARLDAVILGPQGLEVTAHGWWAGAAALDQLVTLGVEVADRLRRTGP